MLRAELWVWFMHTAMQNATPPDGSLPPFAERTPPGKIETAAADADDAVAEFEKRFPGLAR